MAATIEIRSYHGATPDSGTDVAGGSIRFKQADNDTVDANNPIPVPGAGTAYSYLKHLRFYASTTPDNVIDNLKFYSDGNNGYGTDVNNYVKTEIAYTDPLALGADDMGSGEGYASIFEYTSGAPLSVSGEITNPSTGAFGSYVKLQMTVGTTGEQGTTGSESITFEYDES